MISGAKGRKPFLMLGYSTLTPPPIKTRICIPCINYMKDKRNESMRFELGMWNVEHSLHLCLPQQAAWPENVPSSSRELQIC